MLFSMIIVETGLKAELSLNYHKLNIGLNVNGLTLSFESIFMSVIICLKKSF